MWWECGESLHTGAEILVKNYAVRWLVALVRSPRFPILWLGVILGATLVPLEPSETASPFLCVLCGYEELAADCILNVGLFLPLGAALRIAGWRPMRVVAVGSLLSVGVEAAQFFIPGRDSSLSDVVFNTLGTAIGVALAHSVSTWWRPERHRAEVLSIAGVLSAGSVLGLTGVLLGPAFPNDTYYGGWTPRLGHLEWYGGRVLQASLGGQVIPPGALAISSQVRQQLLSGAAIDVRGRAGPRPSGLAPLFTIADGHQREILLLGVDGDDIVYRYRTRAIASGFRGPEIRARGALRGIAWRDPLSVIVRPADSGYCFRVNSTEHCGLGFTVGVGWALIFGVQPGFLGLKPALNFGWLAALFFPFGLWARFGRAFVVAVLLSLGFLLILPSSIGLLPTPATELVGALAGFLAGWSSTKARGSFSRLR